MFFAIDSSSLPCTQVSASRLGARGPGAAVVPWQAEQTSVNFCADGFPRPPPRPGCGAPAWGAPAGAAGGAVCPCGNVNTRVPNAVKPSIATPTTTPVDLIAGPSSRGQ